MLTRRAARVLVLIGVIGCSRATPSNATRLPTTATATATGTSTPTPTEPTNAEPAGIGPLVPWAPASAWHGHGIPPKDFSIFAVPDHSPVLGYAALDRDACEDALRKRAVPFARGEDTIGVRAPVRLTGPLHGVAIHYFLPVADHAKSHAELIDCRLALSLDDFAASLEQRGIVEVVHLSAYRSKKEGGCTAKYAGEQHCAALALDVASFTKKDGTKLVVERDFQGKVGLLTCTEPPRNELWEIACASAGRQFQVVLTPNWNDEHRNHLHLELTVHDWVLAR
jgi:hypothetical protein